MVAIVGESLQQLVGPNGKVLDALQELTRLAVTQQTGDRSRLMLDVAGHRAARREALTELGTEACDRAKSENGPIRLDPMTPFERKIVHDAVAAAGLISESEGQEPNRFVVVIPEMCIRDRSTSGVNFVDVIHFRPRRVASTTANQQSSVLPHNFGGGVALAPGRDLLLPVSSTCPAHDLKFGRAERELSS